MDKHVFVLAPSVSGINPFIFRGLEARGWQVRARTVGFPRGPQWGLRCRSFHPRLQRWRQCYLEGLTAFAHGEGGIVQRTVICSEILGTKRTSTGTPAPKAMRVRSPTAWCSCSNIPPCVVRWAREDTSACGHASSGRTSHDGWTRGS